MYAYVILYNTAHTHALTHTHTPHTHRRTHVYIILFSLQLSLSPSHCPSLSPSHCLSHCLSSLDVLYIHAEREREREMWCERVFDNESKRGCVYIYGNSWHHSLEPLSSILLFFARFRKAFPQVSDFLRPLRLQTLTSEQQSFTVATTSVEGFEEQPQLLMPAGGLVVFWAE